MRPRHRLVFVSLAFASAVAALAAPPPALINHQGVLRDAPDRPLSGTYDMTFRFCDAAVAGNEILVDAHTPGGGSAVVVSGGLFDVTLGGGTVSDGSGPGVYTSFADVFRDHATVYMSIQVGAETLSPRVRIVAAACALNASNPAGRGRSRHVGRIADESRPPHGQRGLRGAQHELRWRLHRHRRIWLRRRRVRRRRRQGLRELQRRQRQ